MTDSDRLLDAIDFVKKNLGGDNTDTTAGKLEAQDVEEVKRKIERLKAEKMANMEKLKGEIAWLETRKYELTALLERTLATVVTEKAAAGLALIKGATVKEAAARLKSLDHEAVILSALEQLGEQLDAASANLQVEANRADLWVEEQLISGH